MLKHADRWSYDQFRQPDAQFLNGNVVLLHSGMTMSCDSAILFQATNSFEAFGHVKILQGDTLSLKGEYLFYDGGAQLAQMRKNVVMKHRTQTLLTDSLNYDRLYGIGYFFAGGELIDAENRLTSDWGEYDTKTRKAKFNYSVKLKNPQFMLTSDTLHYDVISKWAEVQGPSNIISGNNHIYTERGYYNTATEQVRLYDRPVLFNQGSRLVGDTLLYNKHTGVITVRHHISYEDKKNTLRLYSYNMKTDSVYRVLHGSPHVRAFRTDVQAVCDSLVYDTKRKQMLLYKDPIVWSDQKQIVGEEINAFMNDSIIDSIYVRRQALLIEKVDSTHYNQVAGLLMRSYFDEQGQVRESNVDGNGTLIYFPLEKDSTILYQVYTEATNLRSCFVQKQMSKLLGFPSPIGTVYPLALAPRERTFLPSFAWFDYIRPLSKGDLFEWRSKKQGSEMKPLPRREAPVQNVK